MVLTLSSFQKFINDTKSVSTPKELLPGAQPMVVSTVGVESQDGALITPMSGVIIASRPTSSELISTH